LVGLPKYKATKEKIMFTNIPNSIKILFASLAIKLGYLLFAILLNTNNLNTNYEFNLQSYSSLTAKNDAGWYLKIAENGYSKKYSAKEIGYSNGADFIQSEWAFFPLYPFILKAVSTISFLNLKQSGVLISFILSYLSFYIFYQLLKVLGSDDKKALYSTFVLIVLPFHYYFSMIYTESLFFILLLLAFIAILKNKLYLLPMILSALVLTRPNGLFMLIPLFVFALEKDVILKQSLSWKNLIEKETLKKSVYLSKYFVAGPIVFIAWLFYQKQNTNEFFAFSIAQRGWYREFMFPILAFFRRGDFATQFNSIYTIIVIILAFIVRKKMSFSFQLFILISFLLPLCSGAVTSMPRFISLMFPLTLILGNQLYALKYKYGILMLLLILHFYCFYFWVIEANFSY
jgi:Gpi18-like mannosyltransferase